ncbi:hypothetical protein RWE15_06510 [Virgibacillus halophilus]|uniref:Uncharacterized protein n=1 Tax=Tigheibacillus halophilus TaxID=361280 RepID=A0ABU5C5T9_9BACI|nr:hypothetical protein [Virgibacillus halophilus]
MKKRLMVVWAVVLMGLLAACNSEDNSQDQAQKQRTRVETAQVQKRGFGRR